MRRGEIATSLTILSIIVASIGLIAGTRSVEQIKKIFGRAQTSYQFESVSEVRYNDRLLSGVTGFVWQNSYYDLSVSSSEPIQGGFEADYLPASCKDKPQTCPVRTVWQVENLKSLNEGANYRRYQNIKDGSYGYLNQYVDIELKSLPDQYLISGAFCDASASADNKACLSFCQDFDEYNSSNRQDWKCEIMLSNPVQRFLIENIYISEGANIRYGWHVIKKSDIQATPTVGPISPSATNTPVLTIKPTDESVILTIKPTARPTLEPTDIAEESKITPTEEPEITVTPTRTASRKQLCPGFENRIPADVVSDALINPGKYAGGDDENRIWLSLFYSQLAYHPLFNDAVFLISCPEMVVTTTPRVYPTQVPTRVVYPTSTVIPSPTATIRPSSTPTSDPTATVTPQPCLIDSTVSVVDSEDRLIKTSDFIDPSQWWYSNSIELAKGNKASFESSEAEISFYGIELPYQEGVSVDMILNTDSGYRIKNWEVSECKPRGSKGEANCSENRSDIQSDQIENVRLFCNSSYNFKWTVERVVTPADQDLKLAIISDQQAIPGDDQQISQNQVLELIVNEGATAILLLGDFREWSCTDDFEKWRGMIESAVPKSIPIFAVPGNHEWYGNCSDQIGWDKYAQYLTSRLQAIEGVECSGDFGNASVCRYKGLDMVLSGLGAQNLSSGQSEIDPSTLSNYSAFFQSAFDRSDALWKICAWHRPRIEMQLGGSYLSRDGGMSWLPYEKCLEGGALIFTGHDHMYSRSKTLSDISEQIPDPQCQADALCKEGREVWVGKGRTYVSVVGTGGSADRRPQIRCVDGSSGDLLNNNIGNDNCYKFSDQSQTQLQKINGRDIWALAYGSKLQRSKIFDSEGKVRDYANSLKNTFNIDEVMKDISSIRNNYRVTKPEFASVPGALFIEFNADGNASLANSYFKTIDQDIIDSYQIVQKNPSAPDDKSQDSDQGSLNRAARVPINLKIVNNGENELSSLEVGLCRAKSNECDSVTRRLQLGPGQQQEIDYLFSQINNKVLESDLKYNIFCRITDSSGEKHQCTEKTLGVDNPAYYNILFDKDGQISSSVITQRQIADKNQDGVNNSVDCGYMIANYETEKGDANRDSKTDALDISICVKWLGADRD